MKKFLAIILVLVIALITFSVSIASSKKGEVKLKVFEHFPKGKPVLVNSCTPTQNDQVNDFGWAGWRMPAGGMGYRINFASKPSNLSNPSVSSAVTNSFATWTAADAKQKFSYVGVTSAKNPRYDGTNAILWKRISSSSIAVTYVWYYPSTGQLVESDTVFNQRYKWSVSSPTADCVALASYDLQNIGTHEFGHWVGLDDLYADADKDLTMYGYGQLGELKKDTLGLGDITGVQTVLP